MIIHVSGMTDAAYTVKVSSPVNVLVRIHCRDIHPILEVVDMHGVSAKTFNCHLVFAPQGSACSPRIIVMTRIAVLVGLKITIHVEISSE
jgi:hypothetical protein